MYNNDLTDLDTAVNNLTKQSTNAKIIGYDADNKAIYQKIFSGGNLTNAQLLDSNLTASNVKWFKLSGSFTGGNEAYAVPFTTSNYTCSARIMSSGLYSQISSVIISSYYFIVEYVLN